MWRIALPGDMPAIERMWEAKRRILGIKNPLPDLFASPVVITVVAEDERGRIVDGAFFEAVIDCTKLGGRRGGFQSLATIADELAWFFKTRKFRRVTAAMPILVSSKMSNGLKRAGFTCQKLCFWDRWL